MKLLPRVKTPAGQGAGAHAPNTRSPFACRPLSSRRPFVGDSIARGSLARSPLALGAVAAVALVGCTVAHAPAKGAADHQVGAILAGATAPDARRSSAAGRSAGEKVPAAAKAVTVSEDLGLNQGGAKPPRPATITDRAKVRKLVALVDGLPLRPPGVRPCPADFGDSLTLTFRARPGAKPLAVATVQLSGCREVEFTIGGKAQPALGSASGPGILKIAGLPWKIPVL